jgi:hypothetical protein
MKHQMRNSTQTKQAMTLWIPLMSSLVFFGGERGGQYCDAANVIVIVHLIIIFLHAQNSKIKNSPVEIQILRPSGLRQWIVGRYSFIRTFNCI